MQRIGIISSHYATSCSGNPNPLKDPSVVEPPAPEPSLELRPPGSDPAPAAILLPGQAPSRFYPGYGPPSQGYWTTCAEKIGQHLARAVYKRSYPGRA